MLRAKSNVGFAWHSGASNSEVNSPILSEFEFVRDFMPVQVISNVHYDPVETKLAMLRTMSNMSFLP